MSNIHESGVWEGLERRMRQRNIPRNTGWFFSQFDKQGKSTHTPRSSVTPKGLTLSPIPENPRQRENDEPSQHGGRVESGHITETEQARRRLPAGNSTAGRGNASSRSRRRGLHQGAGRRGSLEKNSRNPQMYVPLRYWLTTNLQVSLQGGRRKLGPKNRNKNY